VFTLYHKLTVYVNVSFPCMVVDISFSVHLTVISDVPLYQWGSLTSREQVLSLIDEAGFFYRYERIPEFLAQVKLSELKTANRAILWEYSRHP